MKISSLLNFILNLTIAGIVIHLYVVKLIDISNGKSFDTVTGLDSLVIELISFVISIIYVAVFRIITSNVNKTHKKIETVLGIIILIVVSISILGIIIFSAGNTNFVFALGPIIIASTFIKLRQVNINEKSAGMTLFGYVWIYILAFIIPLIIVVNINTDLSRLSFFSNFDQSNIFIDTLGALIYYLIIGIFIPTINFIRKS